MKNNIDFDKLIITFIVVIITLMLFASCSTQRHRVNQKNADIIMIKSTPDIKKGGVLK